jgi:hypothetical protein
VHAGLQHRRSLKKRGVVDRRDPGAEGGDDSTAVVVESGAEGEGRSNEPSRLSEGRRLTRGAEVVEGGVLRGQGDERRA